MSIRQRRTKNRSVLLLLSLLIPLLINLLILRSQADPFYSTTFVQSIIIINSGHLSNLKVDPGVALPNWYWQGHTSTYTQVGLIAPAFTTSILSIITGIIPLEALFIPITYVLSILCLVSISKIAMSDTNSNLFRSFLELTVILMWLSGHAVGRFWTLQYHAYSSALYLACLFIIIRLVLYSSYESRAFIPFILLYMTLAISHYRASYALIGGTIGFVVALATMKLFGRESTPFLESRKSRGLQILYIVISCVAILYLLNFYTIFVGGKVDLDRLLYGIFKYLRGLQSSITFKEETDIYMHNIFSELASRLFTYLNISIILIYFSIVVFSLLKRKHLNNVDIVGLLLYSYALFSSFITFLAYFYVYEEENRFSFIDSWLMILLPVYLYTIRVNSKIKKTWTTAIVIIHIILVLCGLIMSVNSLRIWISHNPLTPPPPSVNVLGEFFISFISPDRLHVTMSGISTASRIYAEVSNRNYSAIHYIIFANIYVDSNNISSTMDIIKSSSDFIIITVTDLRYGLYTDINIAKNFVNEKTVNEFFYHLILREDVIFNDNKYFCFYLSRN